MIAIKEGIYGIAVMFSIYVICMVLFVLWDELKRTARSSMAIR